MFSSLVRIVASSLASSCVSFFTFLLRVLIPKKIEVKSEMGSYRNEMKEIREYYIRASESLKQLHKRVDRIDKIIDESHPHQYIEE